MADKTPIRLVFTSGTPTGIVSIKPAKQSVSVFGGTGVTTLAAILF